MLAGKTNREMTLSNKGTSVDLAPTAKTATDEEVLAFDLETHRVKMMLDEPFFAAVLRGVNYTRTEKIPTAGVLAKDAEVHMWWNPRFLASLTTSQVKGLLKHEAMHLALEHTTTRRMTPHIIHNYATDLAINSDIPKDELPEGGLVPGEKFADLTDEQSSNMDAEAIARYERISAKIASLPKSKSSEWYFTKLMEDPETREDIEQGQKPCGKGLGDALKDGDVKFDENGDLVDKNGNPVTLVPGAMDDHDGWDNVSDADRELLKGKISKALEDAVNECDRTGRWGSVSSGMRAELRERVSKNIDWRSILRKFCGLSRRANRTSNVRRLNRKYTGIHPGVERGYTSNIAIYIDQSGSVGNSELELAFAELRNLTKRTTFTTFHFDTSVDADSETEWRNGKTPKASRTRSGGTCFTCVNDHANKNGHRFDGYIIITDGEAAKPKPSRLKRGWLLVPGTNLLFDADRRDFQMQMKPACIQ
jgi:predicted metal-dependent peptidase